MNGKGVRRKHKWLSSEEKAVQAIALLIVAPAAAGFVSPSPNALGFVLNWLLLAALFEAGFVAYRRLTRQKRKRE
jgi:hypothetical protein